MNTARRPWFKFWPTDWRGDAKLRRCSRAARSLWIDLMCLMHECEPYGHLAMSSDELMRCVDGTPEEVAALVLELEQKGVCSRTPEGVLYSRRMVRDESHRQKGVNDGLRGGNPALVAKNGMGDNPPPKPKGKPRAEPLASESSLTPVKAPTPRTAPTEEEGAPNGAPSTARRTRRVKPAPWAGEIPIPLQDPRFVAAWKEWRRWRAEEHKDHDIVTQRSGELELKRLSELGVTRAVEAIEHTIRSQWKGIREPEAPRNGNGFTNAGAHGLRAAQVDGLRRMQEEL